MAKAIAWATYQYQRLRQAGNASAFPPGAIEPAATQYQHLRMAAGSIESGPLPRWRWVALASKGTLLFLPRKQS